MELGEQVDTDDLIGLPVQGTVRHLEPRPKKDGEGFWFNVEVEELFPAGMGKASNVAKEDPWQAGTTTYDAPPF